MDTSRHPRAGGSAEGTRVGMGWFRSKHADGGRGAPSFEDRLAQIGPGVPGRCPSCDGLGYIDSIDIGHRYQIQHCTVCQHRWEYLFDADGVVVGLTELDETGQPVSRSRVRPAPVVPAGAGLDEVVLDLRDPVAVEEPVLDLSPTEQLSPAEWIRQSARS